MRLTHVAQEHANHGCRRLYFDYERDAVDGDEYINYKALRRIYHLAGLQMGRRRRRGRAKIVRGFSLRRATKTAREAIDDSKRPRFGDTNTLFERAYRYAQFKVKEFHAGAQPR